MNRQISNSQKSLRKSALERPGVSMVATCKRCADTVVIAKGMESLTVLHKEHTGCTHNIACLQSRDGARRVFAGPGGGIGKVHPDKLEYLR